MNDGMTTTGRFFKKYWPVFGGFLMLQFLLDQADSWTALVTGKATEIEWSRSLLVSVTDQLVWAFFLIFLYIGYRKVQPLSSTRAWVKLIGIVILVAVLHALVTQFTYLITYKFFMGAERTYYEVLSRSLKFFLFGVFIGMFMAFFLLSLIIALDYYEKYRGENMKSASLALELSKSKLEAIQSQLNPHFLFNALNTISMMVRSESSSKAVSMISSLSDLLRMSLNMKTVQIIPLKEELLLVNKYLEIEQERFSDRLKIEIIIDPMTESLGVPNLILQPILENAFKYGVSENLDSAYIRIESTIEEGNLVLEISNNGGQLGHGWSLASNKGIGLKNVENRLRNLFDAYEFDLRNIEEQELVNARISIPIIQL
jgi:two-component sensor histidine kinase